MSNIMVMTRNAVQVTVRTNRYLLQAQVLARTTPYVQRHFESSTSTNRARPRPQQEDVADIPEKYPSTAAYRPFLRPFAKVFLGAMFTYQLLYWGWEKLRLDEIKGQKLAELHELENQVEDYKQRRAAGLTAGSSSSGDNAAKVSSIISTIKSWF